MSSARGSVDPPTITLEDLNGRFDAYEQSIHGNYLFVQVSYPLVWMAGLTDCRAWLTR
jgi:hypothetical protein